MAKIPLGFSCVVEECEECVHRRQEQTATENRYVRTHISKISDTRYCVEKNSVGELKICWP